MMVTSMMVITKNGQMSVSHSGFERSGSFFPNFYNIPCFFLSIPQKPPVFSSVALGKRKKVNHCRVVRIASNQDEIMLTDVDSGKLLEKQLEFQPTFDEYLKDMESVRNGGMAQKKPIKDAPNVSGGSKSGSERRSNLLDYIENSSRGSKLNMEKVDGGGQWENDQNHSNVVVRRRIKDSKDFRGGGGGLKYNIEKGDGRGQGVNERSHSNVFVRRRTEDSKDIRGGNGGGLKYNMEKVDGQGQGANGQNHSNVFVRRGIEDGKDFRGGGGGAGALGQKRDSIRTQKKEQESKGLRTAPQINNSELGAEFIASNKRVPDMTKTSRPGFERKSSEKTLKFGKGFSVTDIEAKLDEGDKGRGRQNSSKFIRNKFETSSRLGREWSYQSHSNLRTNGDVREAEVVGPSSKLRRSRMEGEQIYSKENVNKISLTSAKLTRGSKFFKEEVDQNDLVMERAAFKSFEVFTDVRGEPRVSRMEMEQRIEKLARWLNGTDIDMPQWMFSKIMHSAKIRFSDHSILRVIQILGKLGNWKRVLQVIEWFQSRERFKSYRSRFIYTAALNALGKAKRPVEALNVFYEMRKEPSSYPDLAAYHCIAITLGQAGHTKELFDVIDCMRSTLHKKVKTGMLETCDSHLEPDIVVYNAVLNGCARRKQWEGAFWVLQQLKELGIQPSSTTYGLVMEVMFACEKYNLVHEFFRKVEKSFIPNSLNYKVLVNTLWREGKTDEAVSVVEDMERRGIVGSASLYYDLARCLCSAGRCHEALMQIDKICKVANKPLVVTYTGLIQACLDMGNVQNGAYIFKQMHKFCSPNLVTCNIMLKGYLEHKMFNDARDLFQKMLDESCEINSRDDYKTRVLPDIYTFNTMLTACATEQKWDDFRFVYQQMLHRGYNFNSRRHLQLVFEACRAGVGKEEILETTWKHLIQAGRVPPPPIIKERFCMKLEKEHYDVAISCITCHPATELQAAFSEKAWLDLFKSNINRFHRDVLVRLTQEAYSLIAGSALPNPVVKNLITSCRQIIGTHYTMPFEPIQNSSVFKDIVRELQ